MRGRAQKTDRGARLARCDNRFARVRLRHALRAMAVRIDVRRAIVRSEGSERPDHIDQKFMRPLFAGPHIMVAVRELPDFTRMDFDRSEEHTSELQSLMRISYAVFCLKKKITHTDRQINITN